MKLKDTGLTFEDIKAKVNKYMIETYERFDFLAETAKDQYMYDENGTPYLDFYAGIAVNSAGNCNEKVVAAIIDQCQDIMQTFNYPYTIPQALLAEKVCETIGMDKIFFQNSGTEANEAMIKMARKYGIEHYGPNRYHIVTAKNGFHGRTFGAMSATGQPGNACQVGFGPMTYGFSYAPYNDLEAFKDGTINYLVTGTCADSMISFLLLYNAMTGNRLSQADGSAPSIQMSYILCKTPEEYEDAVALCSADNPPYTFEELQQFIGPDATFEALKEYAQKFSLEDLKARAGK